jgi:hypothetical protein
MPIRGPSSEPFDTRPPITGLPFVFDHAPKSRGGRGKRSFWHVEPTGNNFEDYLIGDRFARAYLRFIAKNDAPGHLISIVDGMCAARAEREAIVWLGLAPLGAGGAPTENGPRIVKRGPSASGSTRWSAFDKGPTSGREGRSIRAAQRPPAHMTDPPPAHTQNGSECEPRG